MAHVVLEGSGIMPIVGELVTSGVPEHVRVDREWELGSSSGPSDHLQELHGGLSPGAPRGAKNGNYTNGDWTAEAIEERKWLGPSSTHSQRPDTR